MLHPFGMNTTALNSTGTRANTRFPVNMQKKIQWCIKIAPTPLKKRFLHCWVNTSLLSPGQTLPEPAPVWQGPSPSLLAPRVVLVGMPQVFRLPVWEMLWGITRIFKVTRGQQKCKEEVRDETQGQSPAEVFRNAEKVPNGAGLVCVDP